MNLSQQIGKLIIDPDEWVHFVSKPFSLFVVSVWHFCYKNYIGLISQGKLSINDGIFIQSHGVVHSYRKKADLDDLRSILIDLYKSDKECIKSLLSEAVRLNKKAEFECAEKKLNFKESIELTCKVAVFCAVLPRFLAEALVSSGIYDNEIIDICIELKKSSLYPRILSEITEPGIKRKLVETGYPDGSEDLVLVDELFSESVNGIYARQNEVASKKDFVMTASGENSDLHWVEDSKKYLDIFEETKLSDNVTELRGRSTFPGFIRGRANVCISSKVPETEACDAGDILVTVDSNPNLMSLIKRSTALIVEEAYIQNVDRNRIDSESLVFGHGNQGISHGAILSNELKIPCVTGVRHATRFIKTGDMIELDASRGTIQILTKFK